MSIALSEKVQGFYTKLNSRERLLLVLGVFAIVIVLLDRAILGPILSEMKVQDSQIKGQTQTIKRNFRILSFTDSIMNEYAGFTKYLDKGNRLEDEIISDLLRKIETLATKNNVRISNITPGEVEERTFSKEYQTSIECSSSLQSLLRFMNQLEESDYLFSIDRYTLSPKSKGSDEIKCNIVISRSLVTSEAVSE